MNTTRFQVFGLRGIDQRWRTDGQDALNIEDMFITSNDSWRTSGGFVQLYKYPYARSTSPYVSQTVLDGIDWDLGIVSPSDPDDPFSDDFFDYGFGVDPPAEDLDSDSDSDGYGGPVATLVTFYDVPPSERGDTDDDGTRDYTDTDDDDDGRLDTDPFETGFNSFAGGWGERTRRGSDFELDQGAARAGDMSHLYADTDYFIGLRQLAATVGIELNYLITDSGVDDFYSSGRDTTIYKALAKHYGWDHAVEGTWSFVGDEEDDARREAAIASADASHGFFLSVSAEYGDFLGDSAEIAVGKSEIVHDDLARQFNVPPYASEDGSGLVVFGTVEWYTVDGIPRWVGYFDTDNPTDLLPYGPPDVARTYLSGFFDDGLLGGHTRILSDDFDYATDKFFSYMFPESSSGSDSSTSPDGSTYGYDIGEEEEGDLTDFVDMDSINPYSETESSSTHPDIVLREPSAYAEIGFEEINSLHWFCQHNGARQFLLYETKNTFYRQSSEVFENTGECTLKVFDGSKSKPFATTPTDYIPETVLYELKDPYEIGWSSGKRFIRHRTSSEVSIRSQSQCYGGRLYLANGFDETIVFDGSSVEKAGFVDMPPAPSVAGAGAMNSMTIPVAIGDASSKFDVDSTNKFPISKGFYGKHFPVQYFGLGSASSADIGVGAYRLREDADTLVTSDADFTQDIQMRIHYYGSPQFDTRKCGFQYKVTYVNDRGQESAPSSSSNIAIIENGSNSEKNRSFHGKGLVGLDIPIGPKECVARRIYRTRNLYSSSGDLYSTGDQSSFYLLTEIQDNMTTTYVDAAPDTSLGELLETRDLGNFPSGTKLLSVFKNTMFVAGSTLNEIRYSAPLFPESFPEDNIISVGDDDGGQITGMRATKNALVVFKQRAIYLIKGSPGSGFQSFTLNGDIGCIAPDSISELPGLGLVFLSQNSVYLLEGALENTGSPTGVIEIGLEIPETIELINSSAAVRSSGCLYPKDKEYWLSIPTVGSEKNNLCLIYHYEIGSWSIRRHFPVDCMVSTKDHRGYLMMGSNDVLNEQRAGILVYTRGSNLKGRSTISRSVLNRTDAGKPLQFIIEALPIYTESMYETVNVDYQSVFTNFRPAHVFSYNVGYGDNSLFVNSKVNRSIDSVRQDSQFSDQQDPNENYPVYGSAIFDKDVWHSYRPIVTRYDISTTHKGPVRELSVKFMTNPGHKFELIGYDLEAKVGEQRNIKPLNKALRSSRR